MVGANGAPFGARCGRGVYFWDALHRAVPAFPEESWVFTAGVVNGIARCRRRGRHLLARAIPDEGVVLIG